MSKCISFRKYLNWYSYVSKDNNVISYAHRKPFCIYCDFENRHILIPIDVCRSISPQVGYRSTKTVQQHQLRSCFDHSDILMPSHTPVASSSIHLHRDAVLFQWQFNEICPQQIALPSWKHMSFFMAVIIMVTKSLSISDTIK